MESIDTERLSLRPFRPDDGDAAHAWFGDPFVMRYTPTGPDPFPEATRARLETYRAHQRRHGFSKWIVIERASSRPIGDAGLMVLDDPGWIDLGFRLAQPFWGRGFATEVARAWVAAAFETLDLAELGAFAHPENAASLRVLAKLGFHARGRRVVLGMPALCFALNRRGDA